MNDRIFAALQQAGLSTSPQATLDHERAFFALYDGELVYMDGAQPAGQQLSRVPLTEVTRIHSDREGVLRVETASETSVTASLMGYNPNRVQRFFQQVRDTTARAKQLPVMPMNGAPTNAASTSAAPMNGSSANGAPSTSPFAAPAAPISSFNPLRDQPPSGMAGSSRPPPVVQDTPAPGSSSGSATSGSVSAAEVPVSVPARSAPLVISSTPSLPPEPVRRAPTSRPAVTPVGAPIAVPVAAPAPALPDPVPAALNSPVAGAGSGALSARADGVRALSGPLRFLAVVLGVAALALAFFQWQGGQTLGAIWTLLTGGVSLVALLAFAALLTLMSDLARELGGRA